MPPRNSIKEDSFDVQCLRKQDSRSSSACGSSLRKGCSHRGRRKGRTQAGPGQVWPVPSDLILQILAALPSKQCHTMQLKNESAQISQSNHKLLYQGNIFQGPDAQALNSLGLSICEVLPLKNIFYFPSAKYTLLSNSLKPHSYICLTCVHSAHNCNYIYVLLLDMCHVF